ncbi:DUF4139 domain-containing protein [Youngiibacter fragilis]|uniref:DUF4139 domain-containing protein n=1 Tax=Youngiibacter fragilis 232.1 TaxID=994573 RepID=V7I9D9_9CLOT|nr:hypothetical protein [Youngiibacter fragilis]ETA82453.1 hypothetical protein T472_0201090 [Youngiibacter fragilis 232.1]
MRIQSRSSDVKELFLTIYSDGFSTVSETRVLEGASGELEIEYLDVPALLEPDSLVAGGLDVLEYSVEYDLISREKLISRYKGRTVHLKNRDTGSVKLVRLLEASGMPVFQDVETGELHVDSHDELILPDHPDGLRTSPGILMKGENAGKEIFATYITGGLSFTMAYNAVDSDGKLKLTGWARITNGSGRSYMNADISLMAGDVSRVNERHEMMFMAKSMDTSPGFGAAERSVSDFHMYTLPSRTDLLDGESRQVQLFSAGEVPFTRHYLAGNTMDGAHPVITFMNLRGSGLGMPIPAGKVRLYRFDGNPLRLTGEASIGHTPEGGKVELKTGSAFDILVEGGETSRNQRNGIDHVRWEAKVMNHSGEAAAVHYEYHIREKFEVRNASLPYEMKDASTLLFKFTAMPGEEVLIRCDYSSDKRVHVAER